MRTSLLIFLIVIFREKAIEDAMNNDPDFASFASGLLRTIHVFDQNNKCIL